MSVVTNSAPLDLQVSKMAENLIGSEIIKLASEIKERIKQGENIYNLTIGDFDPKVFPIPNELKALIIKAYQDDHTNYPAGNGIDQLRVAVSKFIQDRQGLTYSPDEILISGGARPLIYAAYQAIVDPGDTVVFPVPSWNNNHYSHLSGAKAVFVETTVETDFMPTLKELAPHIPSANFIALCSPLNPTGTVFSKESLQEICDAIITENKFRQASGKKPLYLLFDQIYWVLTYGETKHVDPVSINPEMRNYTIYIDGLSKAFAATGVRVGWAMGPLKIINKMKSILSHVGAWSPKAEQVASAEYMVQTTAVDSFLKDFKSELLARLDGFYKGFQTLKSEGFPVDAIAPQAAIYLTVKFSLHGKVTADGKKLETTEDVSKYILEQAGVALVPFYAFGASKTSHWFRLSVGTSHLDKIDTITSQLRSAMAKLS
jgi:aspartate aminotransferase